MSRQLPPSITADTTPDWLPAGWICHSTVLKRGRQTRTYTNLRTKKTFSTKDQVLEYIKMERIREKREFGIEKTKLKAVEDSVIASKRPSWLPDGWKTELLIGRYGGNPYTVYVNISSGFKTNVKHKVLEYQNNMEPESESEPEASMGKVEETGNDYVLKAVEDSVDASKRPLWLPDGWRTELRIGRYGKNPYTVYVNMSSGFKTNLKYKVLEYQNTLESESESEYESESEASLEKVEETGNEYVTYDYDMDEEDLSENEYVQDKGTRENFSNETSTPLRSQPERMQKLESRAKTQCVFEDEDMSSDEAKASEEARARVVSPFHGVAVECADKASEIPGLTGSFSIEINLESEPVSDSLVKTASNKTGTEGSGTRNIEIIDLDSEEEPLKAQEETANESRRSVFFPHREPPSHSVLVFENSNARSSPSNTIGLDLNTQEQNIVDSKKRKKNAETCSPKNIKKKDAEVPTKKLQKGKKGSPNAGVEENPIEWPEPNPYFPFEPLTRTLQEEDDSVIRKYLAEYHAELLPDFGWPSFANIKISRDDEEEPESKKNKSPDAPPCIQVASSSLPTYNSMGTNTMQQTVAGN